MAQTAPQFDWESARPVEEEPQQTAAAPAPDDTYPGAPLADQQTAAPLSPALFDWESARPVESAQDFDLESAQPLSELAKDPSYIMSREQRRAYRQEVKEDDSVVADFLAGLPTVVPGIVNIGAGTVGELGQQIAQNWYRPDKLLAAFTANVNESQRQNILSYSKLFDYVYRNIRNSDTQRRREGAYGEQIKERLRAEGKLTGDAFKDQDIVMQELYAAKEHGEIPITDEQRAEDDETDYQDYIRGLAFDQSIANITNVSVSGAPATMPDSRFVGRNIATGEVVLPGQFSPQGLAIGTDPANLLAFGAGSLARVAALRRAGILIGKGLGPVGKVLSETGGAIGRGAEAIEGRVYRATGIAPQAQPYVLGAAATTVGYATGGDTPFDQALTGALALLPTMRAFGGTLNKAGAAANAGWLISREASAGAMGAANAEAAAKVASSAIPERYARFVRNEGRAAADSTLRRVAQDQANPRLLRALSQFGDNVGVTSAVRATDDAIGGALSGAAVSSPFALAADSPEQAGGVVGAGMLFGGIGGVVGGKMTRMAEMQDAMVARMLVDSQASGGNAEAFARGYSHGELTYMAGLQAFSRGKLKFVPLTTSEYRVNLDTKRRGGENTAGFHVETALDGTQKVFINVGEPSGIAGEVVKIRQVNKGGKTIEVRGEDGASTFTYVPNAAKILVKQGDTVAVGSPLTRHTPATMSVPEEIGHAIFSSNVMDGLPRDEMRNFVNQRYKTEGVAARGREYAGRIVDQEIAAGVHGSPELIDDAVRDRLTEERFTELSQSSIEDGGDPLDWARDEIIGATLRAATQGVDLNRLRNQSNFSRLAEQMLSSSAQVLRVFGVDVDKMGRVVDPAGTFRDNPVFADPAIRRMVTKYMRDYDQWLAGMEQAGRKDRRGVRVAPSGKAEDFANSQHTVLREVKDANGNGTGVFENDVITRGPDGVVRPKKQSDIDRTEVSRAAQIKSLWDAGKTVPTASTEFGKRRVNGRDIVGGPTLPPQWDLFTQFPQWIREFARQLEAGRAEGRTWIADYNAIGTGSSGRYRVTNLGNIEAILREVAFVGWQITKKNHLLATVFDMNAFRAAAKRAIDNGELGELGNNMDEVNATLLQYLDNHKNGRPGEYGIGQTKKNILNGLIGTGTAKQTAANPFYAELNPRGSVRTFRVDRLNDLRDTGRTGYNFMYEPINANMMPDAVRAPKDLSTDQILRELEENQGYLGLSTLGMREGRPVKGGAQRTRELLRRNEELNAELRRRGGPQEESDVARVLRQRGQAMPDAESDAVTVYHGGSVKSLRGVDKANPLFVSESADQAKEYARYNEGSVREFRINQSSIADEAKAYDVINRLGLKSKQAEWNVNELNLFELLDPSFSTSLNKRDISKVYSELEKDGFGAIRFADTNLRTQRQDIDNIVVFNADLASKQPTTGRTRGQAMPDVADAGDQGVAMPKGTVTQLTNTARKALPRLPQGAKSVPKLVIKRKDKPDAVVDGGNPKSWKDYADQHLMPLPNIKLDKVKGVSFSKQDIYDVAQTDRARAQANAQQSVQAAALAAADPLKFVDPVGYSEIMRASGVVGDILIPPSGLKLMLTDPAAFVGLLDGGFHGKRTVPGTRAAAMQGLDGVTEMRQLVGGQPSSFNTALHHFWGTLSKQLDVINQEAAWMRLVLDPAIIEAIDMSIAGKFSMQPKAWEALVAKALDGTQGDFRGKGNNAKANANSFYKALVYHNGRWDEVAALYANNNAIDMRAQFNALGHGKVGMKNKVQGFVGLSFGIKGSVLDRWRFVDLYLPDAMGLTGAATPEQYFKYVGAQKVIPQDPIGIYKNYGTLENSNPAFSLALYNSLDSVAQVAINNSPELRNYLGAHADPGGLHWVTWNSIKNEAVGHSSLDITKNFVRQYGRNGTASDFAKFMRTAEGFVEGSNDAGQITRISLKNGVFSYSEQ